jgi:hypothetical protein
MLGVIEKRNFIEKIAFLKSIPVLSKLTKTSLGKLSYFYNYKSVIRD